MTAARLRDEKKNHQETSPRQRRHLAALGSAEGEKDALRVGCCSTKQWR